MGYLDINVYYRIYIYIWVCFYVVVYDIIGYRIQNCCCCWVCMCMRVALKLRHMGYAETRITTPPFPSVLRMYGCLCYPRSPFAKSLHVNICGV